jgi:prevent-host-death family protein
MTKSVPAAEFEENVHALIDDVKRGDEIVVTENGTAVVKLVPASAFDRYHERMRDTLTINGDLLEPLDGIEWETE